MAAREGEPSKHFALLHGMIVSHDLQSMRLLFAHVGRMEILESQGGVFRLCMLANRAHNLYAIQLIRYLHGDTLDVDASEVDETALMQPALGQH